MAARLHSHLTKQRSNLAWAACACKSCRTIYASAAHSSYYDRNRPSHIAACTQEGFPGRAHHRPCQGQIKAIAYIRARARARSPSPVAAAHSASQTHCSMAQAQISHRLQQSRLPPVMGQCRSPHSYAAARSSCIRNTSSVAVASARRQARLQDPAPPATHACTCAVQQIPLSTWTTDGWRTTARQPANSGMHTSTAVCAGPAP